MLVLKTAVEQGTAHWTQFNKEEFPILESISYLGNYFLITEIPVPPNWGAYVASVKGYTNELHAPEEVSSQWQSKLRNLVATIASSNQLKKIFLLLQFLNTWQLRITLIKISLITLIILHESPLLLFSSAWLVCRCVYPKEKLGGTEIITVSPVRRAGYSRCTVIRKSRIIYQIRQNQRLFAFSKRQ